ncbi:MAG TPA: helix-turn-helix transcriptional regulator [Mycobacteriales bacterium]|jgi:transcriptional regulator with XRE-family HTH domain|nr:helix-turn-helix transcriptional regulator [Mycobacteriales bacterium]
MDKAIHSAAQSALCRLLREHRERAGLRQVDVAQRVGEPQSFVSKYESGERRLDLVELHQVCIALDLPMLDLIKEYERAAANQ